MSKYKYKTTGNIGLFDQETISEKLSSLGNPLEKLNGVIVGQKRCSSNSWKTYLT